MRIPLAGSPRKLKPLAIEPAATEISMSLGVSWVYSA
jgi:hypothetical protein